MKAFDSKQVVFIGDKEEKPKTKKVSKKTKRTKDPLKGLSKDELNEKIEKDYEQIFTSSVSVPGVKTHSMSSDTKSIKEFKQPMITNADTIDDAINETLNEVKSEEPKSTQITINEPLKTVMKQNKREYVLLKLHDMNINELINIINSIINNGFMHMAKKDKRTLIKEMITEYKDSTESMKSLKVSDLLVKNLFKLINFYISISETFKEDEIKRIIKTLAENNFI